MFFALIRSALFEKRLNVNQSTTTSSAILTQENFSFVSILGDPGATSRDDAIFFWRESLL